MPVPSVNKHTTARKKVHMRSNCKGVSQASEMVAASLSASRNRCRHNSISPSNTSCTESPKYSSATGHSTSKSRNALQSVPVSPGSVCLCQSNTHATAAVESGQPRARCRLLRSQHWDPVPPRFLTDWCPVPRACWNSILEVQLPLQDKPPQHPEVHFREIARLVFFNAYLVACFLICWSSAQQM